ncbi:MAG: VOC family protein [Actinomycetota bacterium]|nr:VOC family protein [Actinomycetota bacterium]
MPEITKHVETMFSYADLSTTDLQGAKKFYTELFDWQVEDVPMGPNDFYAIFKKNGKTTAAAANQRKEQADAGVPAMWNTYFTVTDVDSRSKEAERAGGTIHAGPFDVFESGRMSVISSPSGAFFSLWQAKNDIGAQVMNEPNTLTWTECVSTDIQKDRAFFTELFGWDAEEMPEPSGGVYVLLRKEEQSVCGLMPVPAEGMPSFWLNYFNVADCEASVDKARKLGATIQRETTPIPGIGRFALVNDPQGAGFGLLEPEPRQS